MPTVLFVEAAEAPVVEISAVFADAMLFTLLFPFNVSNQEITNSAEFYKLFFTESADDSSALPIICF